MAEAAARLPRDKIDRPRRARAPRALAAAASPRSIVRGVAATRAQQEAVAAAASPLRARRPHITAGAYKPKRPRRRRRRRRAKRLVELYAPARPVGQSVSSLSSRFG